jgi:carboxyl-terminal processing protease
MEKDKYIILLAILAVICFASLYVVRSSAEGQEGAAFESDHEKVARQADAILSSLDASEAPNVWDAGFRLRNLGEGVVPHLKKTVEGLGPLGRIAAAWALSKLGQKPLAVEQALGVVKNGKSRDVRVLAADLVGKIGDASSRKALGDLLDGAFDPAVKISLAKALWDTSRDLRAKDALRGLLKSGEDSVRVPAAFALAEIGDIEPVRRILRRIMDEPTPRGRLARVLLRQHDLLKRIERSETEGEKRSKFDDAILEEMHGLIRQYYVDQVRNLFEKLSAESCRGIAGALDPYCAYLSEKELLRLQDRLSGRLVGLGFRLGRRGFVPVLSAVRSDSPAGTARLRPLDEVWEIDGRKIVEEGLSLLEVENLLCGIPGREKKLKIFRRGWFRAKDLTLSCAAEPKEFLETEVLPLGVLYLRVVRIQSGLADRLARAVEGAKDLKAVILDFRNNGGGNLVDTVKVLDVFLPAGTPLFRSEGRDPSLAPPTDYTARSEQELTVPLAVLQNRGTFGTAELVAAVLRARKKAVLFGETTFGKGCFQHVLMLSATAKRTGIQLTVGRYSVEGKTFDGEGVSPDTAVAAEELEIWKPELIDKLIEEGRDREYVEKHLSAKPELLRRLARFDGREPARYPGFEEWFKSLDTHLTADDVRKLLRRRIRRTVGEGDGKAPVADLVEDAVLLKALAHLAPKAGLDLSKVAEYAFAK